MATTSSDAPDDDGPEITPEYLALFLNLDDDDMSSPLSEDELAEAVAPKRSDTQAQSKSKAKPKASTDYTEDEELVPDTQEPATQVSKAKKPVATKVARPGPSTKTGTGAAKRNKSTATGAK